MRPWEDIYVNQQENLSGVQVYYRLSEDYIYREVAGEGMLVPTGRAAGNAMIMLNETSSFLCKAFCEPRTAQKVIAMARERYDDPQGFLEAHILAFIEANLQSGKLVQQD